MDSRGQALPNLIGLAVAVVVGFLVITQLVSGTTLQTNSLVNIALTVFIPVGLMLGIGRVLGFI